MYAAVERLDARVRLLSAAAFSVVMAVTTTLAPAAAGFVLALALALIARFPLRYTAHRFIPLNFFVLLLFLTLPFSTAGDVVFTLGSLAASDEGLRAALLIGLKANAIVLFISALFTGIDPLHLGHALERLRAPVSFTRLLLFTVRYAHVIELEYGRLRLAMRARGFNPRMDVHTLRTFGYLVGMLLVRAFERSERILAAMKCRGFTGHFPPVAPLRLTRADAIFTMLLVLVLGLLLAGGWA
jgi:cobalt/nickel transport system permease protein